MDGYTVVVHGTKSAGEEVLATNERFTFYPPPRMGPDAQCTFIRFGLEWREGTERLSRFVAKIADRVLPPGKYEFDIVFDGDGYPRTSRVGLIPTKARGSHDPNLKISWAVQGGEEAKLYMTKESCM